MQPALKKKRKKRRTHESEPEANYNLTAGFKGEETIVTKIISHLTDSVSRPFYTQITNRKHLFVLVGGPLASLAPGRVGLPVRAFRGRWAVAVGEEDRRQDRGFVRRIVKGHGHGHGGRRHGDGQEQLCGGLLCLLTLLLLLYHGRIRVRACGQDGRGRGRWRERCSVLDARAGPKAGNELVVRDIVAGAAVAADVVDGRGHGGGERLGPRAHAQQLVTLRRSGRHRGEGRGRRQGRRGRESAGAAGSAKAALLLLLLLLLVVDEIHAAQRGENRLMLKLLLLLLPGKLLVLMLK